VGLPANGLAVTAGALGQTYSGGEPQGPFTLTFPVLPERGDRRLRTPEPGAPHFDADDWDWGNVSPTSGVGAPGLTASVRRVVIRGQLSAPASDTFRSYFREQFDPWFALVARWIEVWTGQVIQDNLTGRGGRSRSFGALWDMSDDAHPSIQMLRGGHAEILDINSFATREQLQSAFSRATARQVPPLEWEALRKAMQYLLGNNDRLAVIEAATAAEIAMATAIDQRLGDISSGGIDKITLNANGAAGLVRLLDALDGKDPEKTHRGRVLKLLAEPRNRAVHSGEVPTADVAWTAIRTAQALLQEFSSLPTW
jgi:hypothetical protein